MLCINKNDIWNESVVLTVKWALKASAWNDVWKLSRQYVLHLLRKLKFNPLLWRQAHNNLFCRFTSLSIKAFNNSFFTLQISADRVKELILRRNRFNHIPLPGLEIINADKLVITDNYFHRISAGSITIKTAKVVEVINNQFSVNAVKVVKSSEGSRFYISCNRYNLLTLRYSRR